MPHLGASRLDPIPKKKVKTSLQQYFDTGRALDPYADVLVRDPLSTPEQRTKDEKESTRR